MNDIGKYLCVFLILLSHSCNYLKERKITNQVKIQLEKICDGGITAPDSMKVYFQDSLYLFRNNDFHDPVIKIITAINGDCFECVKRLEKWENEIIKNVDTSYVKFFFILNVTDFNLFKVNTYPLISFNYPLIIDDRGQFLSINGLHSIDEKLLTFLLDKHNNIVLVGNPFINNELKRLYLERINDLSFSN